MCKNEPEDSEQQTFPIEHGDILVCATDGVFDNLFNSDINKIIEEFLQTLEEREIDDKVAFELSVAICEIAYEKSRDKKKKTPFQRKYKKEMNSTWEGGKEDDITAVVSFVVLD